MKKINNNKYRGGSAVYSLNYKFDSVSVAGKFSGTALDLIKRYNELAKEAHSNGNYVEMEVFRQYAEHYRKIVTEINERKNQQRDNQNEAPAESQSAEAGTTTEPEVADKAGVAEGLSASNSEKTVPENVAKEERPKRCRRSFTVVDITEKKEGEGDVATEAKPKVRRTLHRKSSVAKNPETAPIAQAETASI